MLNQPVKMFLVLCASAIAAFGWTSGELTVDVVNSPMNIKVSAGGKTLAEITVFTFGTSKVTSVSSVAEAANTLTLTLSSNISVAITGVDGGINFKSTNPSVTSVMLTLKDQGEHFYGITQHNIATNPDLRGQSGIKDQVTAYQRDDEDAEVYSGFFYTTLGYAGFFDSFAYGTYSFGASNVTTITYNTSSINWYLFYGPKLSKIQKSYFKVIGAPRSVPMWACGPLVWHDDYTGSAMILDHAQQFTAIKIPYSTIWLDRPYNSGAQGWSNMNFEGDFGNPGTWIKTLTDEYYVNLVTWIMPGTFTGTPPSGAFTSSPNQYLDLTDPTQVTWYRNKLKTGQYPFGVKGHKLDRIDNGWTKNADLPAFKDGTLTPERHKKYAYLNCKVSEEFLRVDAGLGQDCFLFPRCAVAGCQQYTSAIWNGDTYADWGGLVTSVGNAFRAGILGFPMWGSDICGYKQKSMPGIENYCRWLSFGVYSGFMELMLDGKEPWKLNAANQALVQNIFNQRFELLPYIYSIINTSADNGVTMMPLVGEYPDDSKTYSLVDEYLFGPALLVAPITSNASSRSVYLPAGKWVNMHNWADEQTGGAAITSPTMSLTQIPVYIKANSLYPTGKVFAGLAKKWEPDFDANRNIAINAFPGAAGESVSFTYVDYVDGNKKKVMTLAVGADNAIAINAPAMTIPGTVVVRLPAAPTKVYLGTTEITAPAYDAATKKLTVPFVTNQAIQVTVNGTVVGIAEPFEPVKAVGQISARYNNTTVELTIPRMTGLDSRSVATVQILSMAGREIDKMIVPLSRYSSTLCSINPGSGVFLVKASVNGIIAGTGKIVVP